MKSSRAARAAAAGSALAVLWAAGGAHAALPDAPVGAAIPSGGADLVLALTGPGLDLTVGTPAPATGGPNADTRLLTLGSADRSTVPDGAPAFLGPPGTPLWRFGADGGQDGPHWDTAAVPAADLAPPGLSLSLGRVQGPGAVIAYTTGTAGPEDPDGSNSPPGKAGSTDPEAETETGTGTEPDPGPLLLLDSADARPDTTALAPAARGGLVWAFTSPGAYDFDLTAEAALSGGGSAIRTVHVHATVAEPPTAEPSVPAAPVPAPVPAPVAGPTVAGPTVAGPTAAGPTGGSAPPSAARALRSASLPGAEIATAPVTIGDGHVDALAGQWVDGRLRLLFKDSRSPDAVVWREPSAVTVHVNDAARQQVPAGSAYSFLGAPGSTFWLIPQVQKPGVVWAGWNTEALASGPLSGPLQLTLTGVDGPGTVAIWQTAGLGGATVLYDSRDGLPDRAPVDLGVHAHANWGFGAAGTYRLTFALGGHLATGEAVTDTRTYTFTVGDGSGAAPATGGGTASTGTTATGTGTRTGSTASSTDTGTPGALAQTGPAAAVPLTVSGALLLFGGGLITAVGRRRAEPGPVPTATDDHRHSSNPRSDQR
ncbi:putative ABC transporter-associated repeat protein [Kitasatospora sp. SolWspMP-SS2h]|uniref:choice-of-anchor M domain-containing protein n=1 Tax=Kitasatospora sp. SolWspMP-SS2h TaxID=1305729 RepID=UPI000DB9E69B|nr:choice-of-anchor M domain-containing protein [Kitasatospora sp. SolWspMP-SS2h]RAJ38415.1 putative ABC transporter-associated repeat protein [Kitasatospora sp. SolWspMP-SS2h]